MQHLDKNSIGVLLLTVTCVACDSPMEQESTVDGMVADESVVSADSDSTVARIEVAGGSDNSVSSSQQTSEVNENSELILIEADHSAGNDVPAETAESDTSSGHPQVDVSDNVSSDSISSNSSDAEQTNGGTGASAGASSSTSLNLNNVVVSESSAVSDATNYYCAAVGDLVELNVSGVLVDQSSQSGIVNLNAYASLNYSKHPNMQIVSHSDDSISVSVTSPDILDLVVQYEDKYDQIYLSAVSSSAAKPLVMKKTYAQGRCGFALYTEAGCAVVASVDESVGAQVDGISISATGCSLVNPHGLAVISLD